LTLLLPSIFALSIFITAVVRYASHHHRFLDIPNERSSHTRATPHGGGVAVMTAFFAGVCYLYLNGQIDKALFFVLLSAVPVIIVSLIDDFFPLSAKLRLSVQTVSAISALYLLGGVSALNLGVFSLQGIWLNFFALLVILWLTNLYNFLDGIDGYAGSEALFVGLAAFLLFGNTVGLIIAAASAGFLLFNWHKASIFMGDVGSAPLGFIFAVLMLRDAPSPDFIAWAVLLSLFWFDASVTLWRRFRNKEKLSRAHKKHAYQRLQQAGYGHDRVVLSGMVINLVLFGLLSMAGERAYWLVFLITIAILWSTMKYVDRKKAFR